MGLNILALYCVMDIDFVRNLADWCQEFGRAGRDGRPARAILCISTMRNKAECLKVFVNAFKQNHCLRMVIARHYDPTCSANDIRNVQPGETDAEKARSCCSVCLERGTMLEPHEASVREEHDLETQIAALQRRLDSLRMVPLSASSGPTPQ